MNIKKIVSAVTAFALSATMFAGFTVHAATTVTIGNGTDTAVVESYTEGASVTEGLQFPLTGAASYDVTLTNAIDISSGQIEITWDQYVASNTYTDGNNNARTIIFLDSNGVAAVPSIIERNWGGLYFNEKSDANHVGGETKNGTVAMKLTVKTNDEGKRVATLTGPSTTSPEFEISGTDIKTIRLEAGSGISQTARVLQLRDMTVTSKVTPAFELSAAEVAVDSTTTTATVNVTGVVGEVAVESDSQDVATAAYDSETGVITVEYVADGVATVTVTATSDGLTKTEEITVFSGTVEKTNVTINYVSNDVAKTVLLAADTVEDLDVGSNLDLTSYIAKVTSYTDDKGVVYSAEYANASVTEVEVTKDMSYDLAYNLTENTYDVTATAARHAQVVISGTSTSGTTVNTTLYTNNAGSATTKLPVGTYTVAATKGGYTSADGEVAVTTAGGTVALTQTMTAENAMFYEDFDTVGNNKRFDVMNDTDDGVMLIYGDNPRSVTVTDIAENTENGVKVVFDDFNVKFDDPSRNKSVYVRIYNGSTQIATIGAEVAGTVPTYFIASGDNKQVMHTADAGTVTSLMGDLTLYIGGGKITGTLNETAIDVALADGYEADVTSITFEGNNQNATKVIMSSVEVYSQAFPELTVATAAPENVTVATGEVEATLAAEDGVAVTEVTETVDLTDATTLYIKVDNAVNGVVPTVTLADETVITPVAAEANTIDGATYYVYQFVNIDLTGAVVTYTGAADATL